MPIQVRDHTDIGVTPYLYRHRADTRVVSYVYTRDLIDFAEPDQGVKQTDPGILRQILYRDIPGLYQAFIQ